MEDKEQKRRERAYKMWEQEGRVEGSRDDHWKRAEEQHEPTEQESEDVTKVNQEADDQFDKDDSKPHSAGDTRPPSVKS